MIGHQEPLQNLQFNFIEIKTFCLEKTLLTKWSQARNGYKIFAKQISDKGLLSGIYKEPFKFNNKEAKNPNFLNGQNIWTATLPKKIHGWQLSTQKDQQHN